MKKEMWLIWKQPITRRRYKIGILNYENEVYNFKYVDPELNCAIEAGAKCFPGFEDFHETYKSNELFANIETRLPNVGRPDYLEILRATKGRLITDNYEFVPAFDGNKIEFDVAGTRHCSDVEECKKLIHINDKLLLELDPENEHDKNAIKVILNKQGRKYHLGYVPRYYSKELTEMLKNNIEYSAMIQGLNFESEINDEDITAFVKLIFNK